MNGYRNYIAHYGVKGMKWGVRHEYRNNQKRWSTRNTDLYKKVAIASLSVAGLAVGATIARRYMRANMDEVIKVGTRFQTLTTNPNITSKSNRFYSAYKSSDKKKYLGMYGGSLVRNSDDSSKLYAMRKASTGKLKLAGSDTGMATLNSLKRNPAFRKDYDEYMHNLKLKDLAMGKEYKLLSLRKKMGSKRAEYDVFNISLVDNSPAAKKLQNQFYGELKKNGYSAVKDMHDIKYSGFKSKAPAIVFDERKLETYEVKQLNKNAVAKKERPERYKNTIDKALTVVVPSGGIAAAGTASIHDHKRRDENE